MRILLFITFLFGWPPFAGAQTSQTVVNGGTTSPVNLPVTDCDYTWVNDQTGIGLAPNGSGNIPSFTAINTGSSPVTATIIGAPTSSGNAYIANSQNNSVTVISTITNSAIATIAVGANPYGVSASPDGSRVYVTNKFSGNVSVINTVTNTVVATIPVGNYPTSTIVSPDGHTLYVVNNNDATISVFKTSDYSLITTLAVFLLPYAAVLSPDGSRLYVANEGAIRVISTADYHVITNITVNNNGIVVSPDGSKIYVLNINGVQVINTTTFAIASTIPTPLPVCIAISPDGSRLYVTTDYNQDGTLEVISTGSNSVVATVALDEDPFGVAVTADGKFVYAVNSILNPGPYGNVVIINTADNSILTKVEVMLDPHSFGNFIASCPPVKYTITVNPSPALPPAITVGLATGTIAACQGTASASPQIQQFTVSGSNLTADITATAPAGFEVSLLATGGFAGTMTIPQTAGSVSNTVVYVRSSATAPPGYQVAKVSLTSPGATAPNVAVAANINTSPTVNTVSNQTVNNGDATHAASFTGTGNGYTWINDMPGIGLAASGSGDIASFTAVNNGSSPVTATVSVTPIFAGFAYIANDVNGTISVVNTITNTVVANITVDAGPNGTAISPDGSTMYVTNDRSHTVSVISTVTNKVIKSIPIGRSPAGIAISPDGTTLYAANYDDNSVSVINTVSKTVTATITSIPGAFGVAVSPDSKWIYVTSRGSASVVVIDAATDVVAGFIAAGLNPHGIAVSADGSRAYVANFGSNTVSVLNTTNNSVVSTINVGTAPFGITMSADGSRVYVANSNSNNVSVISTTTNTVTATIATGTTPVGAAVSADGSLLYVTNSASNTVSVINTANNTVFATVPVGTSPVSFGSFVKNASNCSGTPVTFTITVNPASTSATPAITAGAVTGNISACVGSASVSPNIQQFTVSGSGLTANIIAIAPAEFEVSLAPGSGYSSNVTVPMTGGVISGTVIYVRSASSAPAGSISGVVNVTSAGASVQNVPVSGTVNALPALNKPVDQTLANGATTAAINFTGTGNVLNWVNNTPGIGLPASGTGDIPSFTALNTGSSAVTATITVTPEISSFAYITNLGSNNVSVINTITNTVVTTIAVGSAPGGTAVSPDGSRVYVANESSNNVSVIDTKTNKVTATISADPFPYGVAVSADGTRLYVTYDKTNKLSIINTATNAITATISTGKTPGGVAISADGSWLYVANSADNTVSVINTATEAAIATIPVGINPAGISVSPDGSRVYVSNFGDGTVSVINTATNTVVTAVPVGQAPDGISVSPDGGTVYVANGVSNTVSVISTATNVVTATIKAGTAPFGISVSPDGLYVYVGNEGANTVSVISTATNGVIATIPVGVSPDSFGNFVSGGARCSGAPVTFTITVTSKTASTANIVASSPTGNIIACVGGPSASPAVQQFTVSGSGLTADISAAAPAGFETSLTPVGGYSSGVTLAQSAGNVNDAVIYVRSAGPASSGNISGNVILTSAGAADVQVSVSGTVNALPVVNPVGNQSLLNGNVTAAVSFSGTASFVTWVNDKPGIGLPASGQGDIPSFTAINPGNNPVTATITATATPTGFAYITNSGLDNVTAVNTITHAAGATIPVGKDPFGIAVSVDGSKVYVGNTDVNTVSVISTFTNTVTATIPVHLNPIALAVSPDGSRVYVTYGEDGTVISVINTATNSVTDIPMGLYYYGIAVSPGGGTAYVVNYFANTVSAINTTTNAVSVIATIPDVLSSWGIALSPDGTRAYVTSDASGVVSVINLAAGMVAASISVGQKPFGVAVSPDGSRLYVTNSGSNTLTVINTATNAIIANIEVGAAPWGVSVNPYGTEVYVANYADNNVSVIDASTNKVIATVPVGKNPRSFGGFVSEGSDCSGLPVTFTITVNPTNTSTLPIIIPNTFTPNGDGVNDTWNIKNIASYSNCTVQVFNRWGQNVYSSTGYGIPWNGASNGAALPTGTYYYVIDLKSGSKLLSGFVAIVR